MDDARQPALLPPLPAIEPGAVWLVGAGPGDPGLLTLHALNGLRLADSVVYDALVSPEILALARPGATLEYAGKRGGKPSARQPDICSRLVRLARQGRRVLRLKGGDPFVFGRGGEEALTLAASRIPFRLVPGVTAAAGGLAAAGIPMTHRTTNSAVTLLTGHDAAGGVPDGLDWQAVARGAPVLVFYMALRQLDAIAERLTGHGLAGDTPVALISQATTGDQRVVETQLAAAAAAAGRAGIEAPCLVVVGDVVRLRQALDPDASVEARAEAAQALARHWRRAAG